MTQPGPRADRIAVDGREEGRCRMLRGGAVARRIRAETTASADLLVRLGGRRPTLVTVQVGEHPSASAYRDAIRRTVAAAGVVHQHLGLPNDATPADLLAAVQGLNASPGVHGIVVLTPLPAHLTLDVVLEYLSPLKDVDGITPTNAGRLYLGLPSLKPSTPQGGIELLDHYGVELEGKRAVVVGRSAVVGRPLAMLLTFRNATVTLCHRHTPDLGELTRSADLVALAAGRPGLLDGSMVQPGAVVIDFGVNVVGDRIVGDADAGSVMAVAGAYTPVPGGTGPVTTLVLARNTVAAAYAALHGTLDECDGLVDVLPSTALPAGEGDDG